MRLIVFIYGTEMRVASSEKLYQYLIGVLLPFAAKDEFEIYMPLDRRYSASKKMAVFLYFSAAIKDKAAEIKEKLKTALKNFFPNETGEKIPVIVGTMEDSSVPVPAIQPAKILSLNVPLGSLEKTPLIKFLLRTGCFETVDDIASKTERELLKMKVGIGKRRLAEIKRFLKDNYNVELKLL